MNRIELAAVVLLTCAATGAHHEAHAQARGPSGPALKQPKESVKEVSPASRATKLVELETWLQRLVGRFRYEEGSVKLFAGTSRICAEATICYIYRQTEGTGDCARLSGSPGVRCSVNVPWPRFLQQGGDLLSLVGDAELKWPGPFLDGAMILYGIDPDKLGIRFLLVDGQSTAYEAFGEPEGDTVTFRSGCGGDPSRRQCRRIFWIRAEPDGKSMDMRFDMRTAGGSVAAYGFKLRQLL